jgi:hypothetical protein
MSLSVCVYATANESTNTFRHWGRPMLPHAGHRCRGISPEGWSKKVNYLQVFTTDTLIIRPYFRSLSWEPTALSADAKNTASALRI